MKAVTINLLRDGRVAYLGAAGEFVADIAEAALFDGAEADDALARVKARTTDVADAYLIDAAEDRQPNGRDAIKETIRSKGPTVREDLGKQAGRP